MIYAYSIKVLSKAGAKEVDVVELPLAKGRLHRIYIQIPSGHQGLAHLQLYRGLRQIIPISDGESISGDDSEIAVDPGYEISESPFQLEAHVWNLDEKYDHTFHLVLGVRGREKAVPAVVKTAAGLIKKLGR